MRKQSERPQCGNKKQSRSRTGGAKRLLSLALSLCLALAMMPGMSITASAATNVAQNTTTTNQYATLQEAVNAVTSGQTIKLLDNIILTSTVVIPDTNAHNFTLDLNSKTLDGGSNTAIRHNGSGTLTITDIGTGGKITSGKRDHKSGVIYLNGGSLDIAGGTVENTGSSGNNSNAIYIASGSVSVTGGTVKVNAVSDASYAIYNEGSGSVSVTAGTVQGDAANSFAIRSESTGSVTISGGEVRSANGFAIDQISGGTVTVSGGIIDGKRRAIYIHQAGKITISGAPLIRSNDNATPTINHGNSGTGEYIIEITGGTVENLHSSGKAIQANSSGTISVPSGSAIIKGGGNAVNKAPDFSSYAGVRVTASTNFDGSDPESLYDSAQITSYKYLKFEPLPPETTPNAGIDYVAEKLINLSASAMYPVNSANMAANGSGEIAIDNSWFGTTISIVKKGNGTTTSDSTPQSITLAARPAAPAAATFTVNQPTADSATATIAGITTAMAYSTDNGSSWTNGSGSPVGGLSPGTVWIRVKATAGAPAGLHQSITIAAYSAPPAPSSGKGSSTPSTPTYKADVKEGDGSKESLPVTFDKDSKIASVDTVSRKNPSGETVITLPAVPDAQTYAVGIPVPDISTKEVQGSLTVETEKGSLTLPSNMLTDAPGASGTKAQLFIREGNKESLPDEVKAAIGERPLISLTLSIDGKKTTWSNPKAPVTVTVPYKPTAAELQNPEGIVVWYIEGNGKFVTVPKGRYDGATGTVTFEVTHFSNYAVAYNKVNFNDVKSAAWYSKAVNFIAAREITGGTGEGVFSPNAKLTRGQFMVMLMKAYSIEPDSIKAGTESSAANFADAGNTYYTGYLAAAKRLGITAGVGDNLYAPGKEINRQEMFTLLYNALKVIGQSPQGNSGKTLGDFTDAETVSPWAKEAMATFAAAGIVSGSNGALLPKGTTTRAEMAQVLYSLLGK